MQAASLSHVATASYSSIRRDYRQRDRQPIAPRPKDARDRLGHGRYGSVQRAWDAHGHPVAIKSESRWAWARDEGALLMELDLPHVIRALDTGRDAKLRYTVLEHGAPVVVDRRMGQEKARRIMRDVLAGLVELHSQGVYHRDLDVERHQGVTTLHNVLNVRGVYKLIDLNLAMVKPCALLKPICERADGRGAARIMLALLRHCDRDEAARFAAWCAHQRGPTVEDLLAYPWLSGRRGTETPPPLPTDDLLDAWDNLTEYATLPLWLMPPDET